MIKIYLLILLSLPIFFIFLFISRFNYKEPLIGMFIGFLIWLYDWDFLLNAGGPETPISKATMKLLGVEHWNPGMPLFVLMFIGAIFGILVYKLTHKNILGKGVGIHENHI